MQDLSRHHRFFVRIISVFLALLLLVPLPVFATEYPDYGENIDTFWTYTGGFLEWFWNVLLANATDMIWGGDDDYYLNSVLDASLIDCPYAIEMGINNGVHDFTAGSSNYLNRSCRYCGLSMADVIASLEESEEEYVSNLDYTSVSDKGLFELYPSGWHFVNTDISGKYVNSSYLTSQNGSFSFSGALLSSITSSNTMYAYVASLPFSLPFGVYNLILSDYVGMSNYSGGLYSSYTYSISIQGSNDSSTWENVATAYYMTQSYSSPTNKMTVSFSTLDYPFSQYRLYCYFSSGYSTPDAGSTVSGSRTCSVEAVSLAEASAGSQSSRMATFMDAISAWNAENQIDTDANAMLRNFLMARLDTDGSVTDVYDPSLYDEETLIFTEPVTGAQYQTTGWTYDYTSRSYDMDLEAGTFLIDEADITRILLTYGDENVTIEYYDSLDTLIQTDEYAYVVASGSECGLNGHTYSVETTKEPTCTRTGERTYTCSVCGDQKVEDIEKAEHAYSAAVTKSPTCTSAGERMYTCSTCGDQYSEKIPAEEHIFTVSVLKEPTCTDAGAYIYSCATCGNQYTETIEALGHDWLATESVDTTYALPEGTSCSDCSGTDFAVELDEEASTYSCTCNSCGAAWTVSAEVTAGYTVYTCSTCGETKTESAGDADNSLFTSVGNLFADGITWCTEKLTQLVDSLNAIVDSFNEYLETVTAEAGVFPEFLTQIIALLPEDLMAVIWFAVIAFVLLAVWKKWLS